MSNSLIQTWEMNYIQSPIDDIESFLWVFFWAVLQNNVTDHSMLERQCAKNFKNGLREIALIGFIQREIGVIGDIIRDWHQYLLGLSLTYTSLVRCFVDISDARGWDDDEEEARYWKAAWHGLALEGVCNSLKILLDRKFP